MDAPPFWATLVIMLASAVISLAVWLPVQSRMEDRADARGERLSRIWDTGWFLVFLPAYVVLHVLAAWLL